MNRFWESAKGPQQLHEQLRFVEANSPFYRRLLRRFFKEQSGGAPWNSSAFANIPFTTKEDLRQHFPEGFRAVPKEDVAAYFESSGTSDGDIGSSRSAAWRTRSDLERDYVRRRAPFGHLDRGSVAIIHLPYALTSSAQSFHQAFSDAGIIPVALDQGQILSSYTRVIELCESLNAAILVTSDPWLIRDVMLYERGDDPFVSLPLRAIATVGVPLSAQRRNDFTTRFGIEIYNFYGLSEFGAVGIPQSGHTCISDDFFVEVHNPSQPGSNVGELIVTDLTNRASPLIRYRTGDVGQLVDVDGCTRVEVFGRLAEAIPSGDRFLMPTDFQDLFVGLQSTSPIHRVTVSGGSETDLAIKLDIQQYARDEKEIASIQKIVRDLTSIPVAVTVHAVGALFPDVYKQTLFRNTQTAKRLAFHDERRGNWIVTY